MTRFSFLLLLFLLPNCFLQAQDEERNQAGALLTHFTYGFQVPDGDLAKDYGNNNNFGLGLEYISGKHNLLFGIDASFMFGNQVKNDVLASLRTPEGGIIGNNKVFADVVQRERGFNVSGRVGKLFVLPSGPENRAGIRATLALGLLQHKVRIQDDFNSAVPQLAGEYKKGYDKLTNGLSVTEFIGYQMLSNNRLINFYVGFEFTQGYTQNRRDWDFAEQRKIDDARRDLLYGIRAGWILPFYIGENPDTIYY